MQHDATSGICPLNLCIYMVPVGVKSYKRPQSFNRPPDCRERREKGLGAESIRDENVKGGRDFLAGNASPCLPREHRIGGHDIINALPYRGDNLRILWSVKDCLDELGYKNHHILLGTSRGHSWRAETYS